MHSPSEKEGRRKKQTLISLRVDKLATNRFSECKGDENGRGKTCLNVMVVKFWRSRTGLNRKQDLQGPGPGWIGLDSAGLELGTNLI
ncbi:Uncharacterized protein HZ326_4574 [Fusarium oxysporum f. sp. albedinis]|nr:Uncharacterized protein HZ326_4574 [Fusarium oxysporum f. sp. albedinis]